ncbi:MAG: hypothetical protein M3O71_11880 [Bacteroidota bacterium]|nr:hypothetical protein [Bacteroidota bacterium]
MENDQAVIIYFNYGLEEDEPFYDLSAKLGTIVDESGLGEYDGHEIAMDNSEGSFYMYGPDAKKLFEVVKGTIEKISFMAGASIVLRLGPPEKGVKEVSFDLNLN